MLAVEKTDVVIIGGGCSGALVLASLLRNATTSLKVHLIERRAVLGEGVAYSTKRPSHVLNVPCKNMSGIAEEPSHLLNWMASTGKDYGPLDFLPRRDFSEYLRYCIDESAKKALVVGASYSSVHSEVVGLQKIDSWWQLEFSDRAPLFAKQVVLATGLYFHENEPRIIKNPWVMDLASLGSKARICVVGAGLSMVDMVLWLNELGFQGKIEVLAKFGNLPLAHRLASFSESLAIDWLQHKSLRDLFRAFRGELRLLPERGLSWHSLIDSLRPYTQTLWQRFTAAEKKRFGRHLAGLWDQHRHRIAPSVSERMQHLKDTGFFSMHKAMVERLESHSDHVMVHYKSEGTIKAEAFDYVISCMGLESNYTRVKSPVIEKALAQGYVCPGSGGRGLLATKEGRLIDNQGQIHPDFYTLGFMQVGNLFESIAVPEIRSQAQAIAQAAAKHIGETGLS